MQHLHAQTWGKTSPPLPQFSIPDFGHTTSDGEEVVENDGRPLTAHGPLAWPLALKRCFAVAEIFDEAVGFEPQVAKPSACTVLPRPMSSAKIPPRPQRESRRGIENPPIDTAELGGDSKRQVRRVVAAHQLLEAAAKLCKLAASKNGRARDRPAASVKPLVPRRILRIQSELCEPRLHGAINVEFQPTPSFALQRT